MKQKKNIWQRLSRRGQTLTIGIAVVVVLLLIFLFVPMMQVAYAEEESYQAVESYYVKESYTVEEEYIVMEPYTAIEAFCDEEPCEEYIPIDYLVVSGQGYNYFESDGSPACSVELNIKNTDVIDGTFTVEFLITVRGDETTTISGSKYIPAGATQKVIAYYDEPLKTLYSFSYSVIAPEKPNPSYREEEVTKYREVVEYGEVTKYEYVPVEVLVLKTRTVTSYKRVSFLSYLINY